MLCELAVPEVHLTEQVLPYNGEYRVGLYIGVVPLLRPSTLVTGMPAKPFRDDNAAELDLKEDDSYVLIC